MTDTHRWIQSAIEESENPHARLPWERGIRRQAFMARRRSIAALAHFNSRTSRPAA